MKKFRKCIVSFAAAFFCTMPFFSSPAENLIERRLENGLTVFLMQDYTIPSVRTELVVRAGFSDQNINNAGFFSLYSKIVQQKLSSIVEIESECNSDVTRYVFYSIPSDFESKLSALCETVFSPQFTDEVAAACISEMKRQVLEKSNDTAAMINAAIDSRVFEECPWKHDSGIYPALFAGMDLNQIRSLLYHVSDDYYNPENCALFITGCVPEEQLSVCLENTAGRYTSSFHKKNNSTLLSREFSELTGKIPENKVRKFVLHDKELSADMTQIVIQYKNNFTKDDLYSEKLSLLAAAMNEEYSFYKESLLSESELAIPGAEYIDVSAAHKREVSRLIIQSLLQKEKNISPCVQAELFLDKTSVGIKNVLNSELYSALNSLLLEIDSCGRSATEYMMKLSQLWASGRYSDFSEYMDVIDYIMMEIEQTETAEINGLLAGQEPYVFVLVNSSVYKKYKKEFSQAGYEVIDSKNASWYSQSLFDSVKKEAEKKLKRQNDIKLQKEFPAEMMYYHQNKGSVMQGKLSNEIPFYAKKLENTNSITILMSVEGGKLASYKDNGFEELMINIIAGNVREKIRVMSMQNLLSGEVRVYSQTGLAYSTVGIECLEADFELCVQAASDAVILGEINPAMADRLVASAQHKKRLENGSASYQMQSEMMKILFGKSPVSSVYACKDILEDVNFDRILASYQDFLVSSRYAFALSGALPDDFEQVLDRNFTSLINMPYELTESKLPSFPKKKNHTASIVHTFLTDVPASKAGKMPAVLVPTTEFLDPVIYAFNLSSCDDKTETAGDALCYYIRQRLSKFNVSYKCYEKQLPFVSFVFMDVKSPSKLNEQYRSFVRVLREQLSSSSDVAETVEEIKNAWVNGFFGHSDTTENVAQMIMSSVKEKGSAEFYLDKLKAVNELSAKDLLEVLEKYFMEPDFVLVSKEAAKN